MINYNGKLIEEQYLKITIENRALRYGDSLFETIKVNNGKIVFAEDHYFRLMASMRMIRMIIPMTFTQEFFENEISKTVESNNITDARVRFTVFRKDGGMYLPDQNNIDFVIKVSPLMIHCRSEYEIDIFKDFYVYSGILSTLKTNNKILNVIANIYADENDLNNCILINENKNIVEVINANIFLVKDKLIKTPSISEGCLKGIIRKKVIEIVLNDDNYKIEETEISPFELQKADEVFITNSIIGIQHITKYRKKSYTNRISKYLLEKLNVLEGN